ncbi:MAG: FtsX-like permease family protein [Acidobacteria bacterium]|nr:FtsX-like permease family protein [Acidobacteriota bacterium]
MRFIFQMARRELRSSWRRLLFFFACIAIGVCSIVALRSMIQNVNRSIASDGRAILTADLQVDTDRPWTEETLAIINRIAQAPRVTARTETIESSTMARPADDDNERAMMIELKGIEAPYPLAGDFVLEGNQPFNISLLANHGAMVSPALLDRLQLKVGDAIKIGEATFQIRAAFQTEPGVTGGFRLGPRVFIARSAIDSTGLTGFGSRARRKILFSTVEGQAEPLVKDLRKELKTTFVNIRSYKDSQENLNQSLTRAEDYLSLTGLVILVLGGIGISNVTRVFVEQKKKSIAVLKCLGASGSKVTITYLVQVIALGVVGSAVGVALARLVLYLVEKNFADSLPVNLTYDLRPNAVVQGLGVGIMISLLFSVLPLLRIRNIKPNVLLRDDESAVKKRFDVLRWTLAALVLIGLITLVSWQAGSLKIGLFFLAGVALTAGLLYLAASLLIALVRRTKKVHSFAFRQAISSLYRPGNQTRVIIMVVGLGVFLVIAVQSLQKNLMHDLDFGRRTDMPNMFLIDVQKDQQAPLAEFIKQETGEQPLLVPTVRARITAINGRDIDFEQEDMKKQRGLLGREYVVTYRPNLEVNEHILEGEFWNGQPSKDAEVSIEESLKGLLGLAVNSTITFDIQGRKINAKVTSIRKVEWRNSRTGFMVLFRPGTLENAPQMMIGAINGPTDEVEKSRFESRLLDKFPNLSIVDVTEIVRSVTRIINNVTLAISFTGLFVFLSGVLILIGSIAITKFQRIYEAAVLKTLGAKRKTLLAILLAEYGVLGLVAGLIGAFAAEGLSYATARWVFEIEWSLAPQLNFLGVVATIVLVTVVGAVSTLDVLYQKPLGILRGQ